jgi:hypothetical protein
MKESENLFKFLIISVLLLVGQDIYNIVKDRVSRGSPLFTSELDI